MIRHELSRVPERTSVGANQRKIGSIKDRALLHTLFLILEGRPGFREKKPHHFVTVTYRGIGYTGTVRQFRDANENATKQVGSASAFLRRQLAGFVRARRVDQEQGATIQ